MSLDARLSRLSPALTARERAILILKADRDKTHEDPSWLRTLPSEQRDEFNRLIGLMNASNKYLPLFITMVEGWAQQMEVRLNWWITLTLYGTALWELGKLVPPSKRTQAVEAMAGFFPFIELPWDGTDHELSWLNVADSMLKTTRQCVAHLWDDLTAIDTVLADVAVQFGGENPLRPVMRGQLEKARGTLTLLNHLLSGADAVQATEPSQEALELARIYFDKGTI